jgi:hypothetical protein
MEQNRQVAMCQVAEGERGGSVMLFRHVPHSIPCIELLHQCQKFCDDPSLVPSPYMIQSNMSPDTFTRFLQRLDGAEPNFSPETFNDLMLLKREFGQNSLITRLVPQ